MPGTLQQFDHHTPSTPRTSPHMKRTSLESVMTDTGHRTTLQTVCHPKRNPKAGRRGGLDIGSHMQARNHRGYQSNTHQMRQMHQIPKVLCHTLNFDTSYPLGTQVLQSTQFIVLVCGKSGLRTLQGAIKRGPWSSQSPQRPTKTFRIINPITSSWTEALQLGL